MLTIHRVLRDFAPLVRFYIVDARLNSFGHGQVKITVWVPPDTSAHLRDYLWTDLIIQPSNSELLEICDDLNVPVKPGEPIQVSVKILDMGEEMQ